MTTCTRCLDGTITTTLDNLARCSDCGPCVRVIFSWDLIQACQENYAGQGDPAYAVQSRLDTRSGLVDGIGYALWIDLSEFRRVREIQDEVIGGPGDDGAGIDWQLAELVSAIEE